jgi:hypothetical protein
MPSRTSLFLILQISFDVFEHEESLLREEFVKVEGALRIIDLLLKHLTQVFNVDIRVLYHLVG